MFILTDITKFRQSNEEQTKDQLNEENVDKVQETAAINENMVNDRPPPMPKKQILPLAPEDSNITSHSVGPQYVEVLENVDRPVDIQALARKPPYIQPRLSLLPRERSTELSDCAQQSSKLSPLHFPEMQCDSPHREESPYSDMPCVSAEQSAEDDLYSYASERLESSSTKGKQKDKKKITSNLQPKVVFTITSEKVEIEVIPSQNYDQIKQISNV